MIVPLTPEEAWLSALGDIPVMDVTSIGACVISPHPDDETLGAGGLIYSLRSAGMPVTVIAVTDGENAYKGESNLGPVREREQCEALRFLGVDEKDILRLRLPDSSLHECESVLYELVSRVVRPGMQIIAPWIKDFHPDH